MRIGIFSCVVFSLLPLALAQAAPVEGHLELTWGDGPPHAKQREHFDVRLVTTTGERYRLEPQWALKAADDLFALAGKPVAVEFAEHAATPAGLKAEAIVPTGDTKAATQAAMINSNVWVTLACKFADIADEPKTVAFFLSQYGTSPGQLGHYWRDVSYDKIDLAGSNAYGWFTLPNPRSTYISAAGAANLDRLFNDCTGAANDSVNFASGVHGINLMFNGELDGTARGGSQCATLDGLNKCWSTTWMPPWAYRIISVLMHEMGHGYGLPHTNNSDGDNNPYDSPWDVLSDPERYSGTDTVFSNMFGSIGKHLCTYSRNRLGWVDAARKQTISTAGTYVIELDRASLIGSTRTQMIVVNAPGDPASRYFTIEARKRNNHYDSGLPGDAVIIHEVVTTRSEPAWVVDAGATPANYSDNEDSMFKVGETYSVPDKFSVTVNSATAEGFKVTVVYGSGQAADLIFKNGFQ